MKYIWLITLIMGAMAGCCSESESAQSAEASDTVMDMDSNRDTDADTDSEGDTESNDDDDSASLMDSDSGSGVDIESDSAIAQCCPMENIFWGVDCMMDHADPVFTISRCGQTAESPMPMNCAVTLPDCTARAQVDAAVLNALLERQDVQDAFVADVTQDFGLPIGIPYHISLQHDATAPGRSILVGLPCDGADECTPIPEGVSALRELLDTIVANKEEYGLPAGNDCAYHQ